MKLKFILLSLLVLVSTSRVLAQAKATAEDSEMLMGTLLKLEVRVPMPSDSAVIEFPALKKAELQKQKYISFLNDTLELLTSHKRALESSGGTSSMRYDLYLQAFDSGRYQLPPLEFIVDGEKVMTNPVDISVLPVKVKADDKIDDFTGVIEPFEINPNPEEMEVDAAGSLLWWWIAAGLLILVAVTILFIFKRNGRIFTMVNTQTPYEVAIQKLRKLQNQNLPQRGKTKEYYTRLTGAIREYLKKQFGIKTYEKTSTEILLQVEGQKEIARYADILSSIFKTADFVKFAKVNPSEAENSKCIQDAIRFLEASRPVMSEKDKKGGGK